METLKQQAIYAISGMPETVDIDEIMYKLYVIDKVRKGRQAIQEKDMIPTEHLKREIESW